MQGEIKVMELMDRAERLELWRERQQRDTEWVALKQWWRADRRVRDARSDVQRWQATMDRARTAWLYRAELASAWPKWKRTRGERWRAEPPLI